MDRYVMPHMCLLCPQAAPFKSFWAAVAHVRFAHQEVLEDQFPDELVRYVGEGEREKLAEAEAKERDSWLLCLHCLKHGRREIASSEGKMTAHYRQSHVDSAWGRMGIRPPDCIEGEDYIREIEWLQDVASQIDDARRHLESIVGVSDLLTDAGLGFFKSPPEEEL